MGQKTVRYVDIFEAAFIKKSKTDEITFWADLPGPTAAAACTIHVVASFEKWTCSRVSPSRF